MSSKRSIRIMLGLAIAGLLVATPGLASEQLEEQLDIQPNNRTQGPARDVADQLLRLGQQELEANNYDAAIAAWYRAIDIYTTLGDFPAAGLAYDYIGRAYTDQGRYAEAEAVIRRRLAVARDTADFQGQVIALNNLGNLLIQRGHLPPAQAAFQSALDIAEDIEYATGLGLSLSNLGLVAKIQGDFATAIAYYEDATGHRLLGGDLVGQANTSNNLGQLYQRLGEETKALGAFLLARRNALEAGNTPALLTALDGLIAIYRDRGDLTQLRQYLNERVALTEGTDADPADQLVTLIALGRYFEQIDDPAAAQAIYRQALVLAEQVEDAANRTFLLNRLEVLQFEVDPATSSGF